MHALLSNLTNRQTGRQTDRHRGQPHLPPPLWEIYKDGFLHGHGPLNPRPCHVCWPQGKHDFGQLAIAPLALLLLEYGTSCPPTSSLHRQHSCLDSRLTYKAVNIVTCLGAYAYRRIHLSLLIILMTMIHR